MGCASAQAAADTFVHWEVAPADMAADTFPGLEALARAGTFDPEVFPANIVADVAHGTAMDLYRSIDLLHSDGGCGGSS